MNVLFHMYLSGDDPELLAGNFMGDFVKGPLGDDYPPRIRQGLILHRKIDSFAQGEANFQSSRLRLPPHFGLYRGVLVDLFYDHFLARSWHVRTDRELADYLSRTRKIIETFGPIMPERLQGLIPFMFDELLLSYRTVSGITAALRRMSLRVKRENPLAAGGAALTQYYEELARDFERFIVAAEAFTTGMIAGGLK